MTRYSDPTETRVCDLTDEHEVKIDDHYTDYGWARWDNDTLVLRRADESTAVVIARLPVPDPAPEPAAKAKDPKCVCGHRRSKHSERLALFPDRPSTYTFCFKTHDCPCAAFTRRPLTKKAKNLEPGDVLADGRIVRTVTIYIRRPRIGRDKATCVFQQGVNDYSFDPDERIELAPKG